MRFQVSLSTLFTIFGTGTHFLLAPLCNVQLVVGTTDFWHAIQHDSMESIGSSLKPNDSMRHTHCQSETAYVVDLGMLSRFTTFSRVDTDSSMGNNCLTSIVMPTEELYVDGTVDYPVGGNLVLEGIECSPHCMTCNKVRTTNIFPHVDFFNKAILS